MSKQILILGGGYSGLLTALLTARKNLTAEEANITIINRFQDIPGLKHPFYEKGIPLSLWEVDSRDFDALGRFVLMTISNIGLVTLYNAFSSK